MTESDSMSDLKQSNTITHQEDLSHPKQLLGLSYSLQRQSPELQGGSISLLLSAASAEIVPRPLADEDPWGVVVTHNTSHELLTMLKEAIALAQIDDVKRAYLCHRGDDIFEQGQSEEDIKTCLLTDRSLLSQLVDLRKIFRGEGTLSSQNSSERTTGANDRIETVDLEKSTQPVNTDLFSNTVDMPKEELEQSLEPRELKGHLLMLADHALEAITPNVVPNDVSAFKSITVLYSGSSHNLLSWQRWASQLGASLITTLEGRAHFISNVAERIQCASRYLTRQSLYLSTAEGYSISSITHLNPLPSPIPVAFKGRDRVARSASLWLNLATTKERWVTIITLKQISSSGAQATLSMDAEGQRVLTLHIGDQSAPVYLDHSPVPSHEQRRAENRARQAAIANPLGGQKLSRIDSHLTGVAFALQISHRVRVLDNLMLAILRQETRKSAKLIDQLIKVCANLESIERVVALRSMKVKLLATGQLTSDDRDYIATLMQRSTHALNMSGTWSAY